MIQISAAASATLFGALAFAGAVHAMPMGGTYSGRVESQTPQMLGPDHVRVEQTASGVNTGPGTPLDGAKVRWNETVTLRNGRGPVEGTITFTTPTGTTSSVYQGTVVTDAQGRVTAKGKYRDGEATGEFAGFKGSGTFNVVYSTKTDFTGEWKGQVQPPDRTSSRR